MKAENLNRQGSLIMFAVLCMVVLQLSVWLPNSFGGPLTPSLSPAERLRVGERMYRDGLLASGKPIQAFVKKDLPVPGTAFTCISCHLRGGLGSIEGGVYTSATNGAELFKPLKTFPERSRLELSPKNFKVTYSRPAYTDESLAKVLRGGVDPAGRILNEVMPRYKLDDEDMAIMIAYLKSLSSQLSPGVTGTHLRLATVMTDDVSQEDRDAMLVSLLGFIGSRNTQAMSLKRLTAIGKGNFVVMGGMGADMVGSISQTMSLTPWLLKGPPETWRGQLEEYYRKEPVFALIGGITKGEWKPIHQFSEDNQIPCLFPDTDFPVISQSDWYTLYLSKGYYQEGEAAARYLNNMGKTLKGRPIVQIVRDSREGRALSAGFRETWRELGHGAPVTVTLKAGEELTNDIVKRLLAEEKPVAVVLWDGSGAQQELETLAAGKNRPEMVFVSSSYLGKGLWTLKEPVRDFTYITYPFRLPLAPQGGGNQTTPANEKAFFSGNATKEANQAYTITQVLTMVLMDLEGNYYRDNFLDVIGMIGDMEVPLYERISFGPGQRYASKGCYIVQLSKGLKPELIRKSDWVMH